MRYVALALIEEARRDHREFAPGRGIGCRECYQPGYAVDWPCIAARLADALEQQTQSCAECARLVES